MKITTAFALLALTLSCASVTYADTFAAQQAALPVPDVGKGRSEGFLIPVESRPIRQVVDVTDHSTHLLRIL